MIINRNLKKINLFIGCIFFICLLFLISGNQSIWGDELFTLQTVDGSLSNLINKVVSDVVHPPLYYLGLWGYLKITSITQIPIIILAKSFSLLWFVLLLVHGSNFLQKRYDNKTSLLFILFVSGMEILGYAFEIRMYSMAMYFTLMAWLYALEFHRTNQMKDRIVFSIFSLLGIYTHYFSAVYLSLVWFWILYFDFKNKSVKDWMISFFSVCICYLPWLYVMVTGVSDVPPDASPITLSSLAMFVIYPFYVHNLPLTAFIALITLVLFIIVLKSDSDSWIKIALLSPIYVGVIGIGMSLITHKFFTGKYLLPGWCVFWAAMTIALKDKKYFKQLILLFICIDLGSLFFIGKYEFDDKKGYQLLQQISQENQIHASGTLYDILSYYEMNPINHLEPESNAYYLTYSDYTVLDDSYTLVYESQLGGAAISIYQYLD